MGSGGAEPHRSKTGLRRALSGLRLVWKVNGLFLLILASALGISGYVWNVAFERDEVASARELSMATSELILTRVRDLMMQHEGGELQDLVGRMARENPAFRDIRLLAHRGAVVASRREPPGAAVGPDAWPCTLCHTPGSSPPLASAPVCCDVIELAEGERAVSVVTPIYREPGCAGAGCHEGVGEGNVLGMLQTDFSLARVDALLARQSRRLALILLLSLLLGSAASFWMTDRLVGQRIQALREGANRIAQHDFTFRFSDPRGDGLAQLVGVFDDVTSELSTTLSELSNAKQHLEAIAENSADIIITVDPVGFITTFNAGAEKVLGYSREEVIGKRIEVLFHDPTEREAAIAQLEHSDHVVNYITRFVTKKGAQRNVLLTLSRLRAPDGNPIGTLGISKDVTTELRLQRRLVRTERMAALGHAITGIQHSIKNMLNVMKGGAYMVNLGLTKGDPAMTNEGWAMVQHGIGDMTEMSKRMLDFARTRKLRLVPTDLGELARRIHHMSETKFMSEGVALTLEAEPNLPAVQCDAEMVQSVIMDLLSNALDACSWKEYKNGEIPEVRLGLRHGEAPDQVRIEVRDNGEGMTEEVRKRLFTPFFSTKEKKGTGMGLAVVERIVSSHEGRTTVESEPGRGAAFIVSLPIRGPIQREEEEDA